MYSTPNAEPCNDADYDYDGDDWIYPENYEGFADD